MIEPTDEMGDALLRALPDEPHWGWKAEDAKTWLADVLAIIERDYDVRCGAVCPPEREYGELRCSRLPSHSGEHRWFGDDIAVSWP